MEKKSKKMTRTAVNVLTIVFLLEPVWMLLPFAGFFYGSVVNLDFLMKSPATAWLTYFIFPVQTLFPVAIVFSTFGLWIFLIGAVQIYYAKAIKKGLVKNGIYRKFRHPQYTGLTIFCIGFLLIWGRFITYLLFSTMLYLYYHLAKAEEKLCENEFGKEYEEYKKSSWFLFPGEKIFKPIGNWYNKIVQNKIVVYTLSYLLIITFTIGAGNTILFVRKSNQNKLPIISRTITIDNDKEFKLMIVQGFGKYIKGMTEKAYRNFSNDLYYDPKFKYILKIIATQDVDTLLGFSVSRTMRQKKSYYGRNQYDFYFVALKTAIPYKDNQFSSFRKSWQIKSAFELIQVDVNAMGKNKEGVLGDIRVIVPTGLYETKRIMAYLDAFFYSFKSKIVPIYQLFEK